MFTQVNLNTNFLTRGVVDKTKDGFETDSVQIRAKSYWKISGDILPNMPTFIELKAFDGTKNIYDVTNAGVVDPKVADGLDSFATGMLFHPFNYLNGNENSLLGHFAGRNTFVNLETGYNWQNLSAKHPVAHCRRDANAGYSRFHGANIQQLIW